MKKMKLLVGLGNPGEQYENTRHNLGFMAVDQFVKKKLSRDLTESFWQLDKKSNALTGKLDELDVMVVKPQTFMNSSGQAVLKLAHYYKIQPADIIVVYDELDLKLGQIKIRQGGSAAGHHGVESIINLLKTDQFIRVRLGIGSLRSQGGDRPGGHFLADQYVVAEFSQGEKSKVKHILKQTVDALDTLFEEGISAAQNQYH